MALVTTNDRETTPTAIRATNASLSIVPHCPLCLRPFPEDSSSVEHSAASRLGYQEDFGARDERDINTSINRSYYSTAPNRRYRHQSGTKRHRENDRSDGTRSSGTRGGRTTIGPHNTNGDNTDNMGLVLAPQYNSGGGESATDDYYTSNDMNPSFGSDDGITSRALVPSDSHHLTPTTSYFRKLLLAFSENQMRLRCLEAPPIKSRAIAAMISVGTQTKSSRNHAPTGDDDQSNRSSVSSSDGHSPSPSPSTSSVHVEPADRAAETAALNGYYKSNFMELKKIGSGTFGGVYLCRHVVGGEDLGVFAVKKIPIGDDNTYLRKVIREVRVLEEVRKHPNVVEYYHSWIDYSKTADFGPHVRCLFILQEFATEGSLDSYLESKANVIHSLNDLAVWYFFLSAVAGVAHLHSRGMLHRDLKPQNLLLTKALGGSGGLTAEAFDSDDDNAVDYFCHNKETDQDTSSLSVAERVKLRKRLAKKAAAATGKCKDSQGHSNRPPRVLVSDFGTAALLTEIASDTVERTGGTGTLEYMAPELLAEEVDDEDNIPANRDSATSASTTATTHYKYSHTTASDVWSLGMILHYLAFGGSLPTVVVSAPSPPSTSSAIGGKAPSSASSPQQRISATVRFPKNYKKYNRSPEIIELIKLMLDIDPVKRPSCMDILQSPFVQRLLRQFEEWERQTANLSGKGAKVAHEMFLSGGGLAYAGSSYKQKQHQQQQQHRDDSDDDNVIDNLQSPPASTGPIGGKGPSAVSFEQYQDLDMTLHNVDTYRPASAKADQLSNKGGPRKQQVASGNGQLVVVKPAGALVVSKASSQPNFTPIQDADEVEVDTDPTLFEVSLSDARGQIDETKLQAEQSINLAAVPNSSDADLLVSSPRLGFTNRPYVEFDNDDEDSLGHRVHSAFLNTSSGGEVVTDTDATDICPESSSTQVLPHVPSKLLLTFYGYGGDADSTDSPEAQMAESQTLNRQDSAAHSFSAEATCSSLVMSVGGGGAALRIKRPSGSLGLGSSRQMHRLPQPAPSASTQLVPYEASKRHTSSKQQQGSALKPSTVPKNDNNERAETSAREVVPPASQPWSTRATNFLATGTIPVRYAVAAAAVVWALSSWR